MLNYLDDDLEPEELHRRLNSPEWQVQRDVAGIRESLRGIYQLLQAMHGSSAYTPLLAGIFGVLLYIAYRLTP